MKQAFTFLLIYVSTVSNAQETMDGLDLLAYSIPASRIEYIVLDTDTTETKPVLLFLQGSLPIPLIIDMDGYKHVNIPFNIEDFLLPYRVVVISMPYTPLVASIHELNKDYCFLLDTADATSFDPRYLESNVLESYVLRTNAVIADLRKRSWVGAAIHVIGHSQGAKVACAVASGDRTIQSVGLLGFNAFGRYDVNLRMERNRLKNGEISGDEYVDRINEHYARWCAIKADPSRSDNGNNSWTSFSIDHTPYLMAIEVPIFIGYGTEDLGAENCDLLPLSFIDHGRQNYSMHPYPGLDHNFFHVEKGRQAGTRWTEVMQDVVSWIESHDEAPSSK